MIPGKGIGQGFPRQGSGGFTSCRCPNCGYVEEHARNVPCNKMRCPHCGSTLVGNWISIPNCIVYKNVYHTNFKKKWIL